jgi:hypothetical protein
VWWLGYGLDNQGKCIYTLEICSTPKRPDGLWDPSSIRVFFLVEKSVKSKSDHSSSSNAVVKEWIEVLRHSLMCLHSLHTDKFAFIRCRDLCAAVVVNFYIFFILAWLAAEKTEKKHSCCFARFCFHQLVFMICRLELLNLGGKLKIRIKRIFIWARDEMCLSLHYCSKTTQPNCRE